MKRILVLLLLSLIVSCGSSRVITSKEDHEKYNEQTKEESSGNTTAPEVKPSVNVPVVSPKVDNSPSHTTDKVAAYVHKYRAIAQYEMQQTGIPASITLAQGILESGAGNGDLTQRANNHFGIKCHGWSGAKVYHDDDKKGECFRKYNDPAQSFKDHSEFLTSRTRYASLFKLNITDYKGWAKGLRKAGYATDPKYPSKLISLIERYQLYNYDKASSSTPQNEVTTYKVEQGDTLYSIAKKMNLSVDQLMEMNNLTDAALHIGQQLIVQ